MNRAITNREIAFSFFAAGATLTLGIFLGLKAGGGEIGSFLTKDFALLAILIILKFTFAWGRRRGFPVRLEDGSIAVENGLRNLAMAALVWVVMTIIFGPLIGTAVRLAR